VEKQRFRSRSEAREAVIRVVAWDAVTPIVLRVREARNRRGWTQAALATRARVRRATIISLESGHRQRINLSVLEKVAKALGVPTPRLLREE